jgi:hypothetical protein
MANFSAHPPQGQKLPDNWKIQAEKNRREFDEAYKRRLENQWRQPQQNHGIMQAARLRPPSWDDVLGQK